MPNGDINKNVSPQECMRFWADGMPDEAVSSGTVKAQTEGSSHEVALEGETGASVGAGSAKVRGSLKHTGGESTTSSQTSAQTKVHAGSEGYKRECARLENAWFNGRIDVAEPFAE